MTNNEQNMDEDIKSLEDKLKYLKEAKRQARGTPAQSPYAVPVAVIIAGILIAGAVFYSGRGSSSVQYANTGSPSVVPPTPAPATGSINNIKPVGPDDHIRGSIDAPVKIVEFSDYECPFCKKFHPTMQRVVDEYGKDGQVAWIYRHFPLDSIHPFKARNEAKASECVNELGGNDAFWKFSDEIFRITPSNNQLDQSLLPDIAEVAGVDRDAFEVCMQSTKYDQHIEEDLQDAIASGGTGTPYSVLIAPNGQKYPISGAQPYAAVKSLIDIALKQK